LSQIRHLHGGDGDDFLVAHFDSDPAVSNSTGSTLFGGRGFDELRGAGGDDLIIAGYGTDLVFGGAGNDIFQIATDMDAGYYSRLKMETILGNLLGVDTETSGALVSALESAHLQVMGSALNTQTTYDLAAIVTDFSRSGEEADRIVFDGATSGDEIKLQWIGKEIWGGQQDLLYAFTRVGNNSPEGVFAQDAYTAALIIPEFSPTDVSLLDLARDGILSV
jgi:Ca2+-binding RTX toxin-like protein